MKRQFFLTMVLANVLSIKANATPEQIGRLNFKALDPTNVNHCLLGQLTEDTPSQIKALMGDSTKLGVNPDLFNETNVKTSLSMFGNTMLQELNNNSFEFIETFDEKRRGINREFEAVELFLYFKGANVNEMYEFLQGERETFEPTMAE